MKVSVAKRAGFCFGVKRALEMANKAAEENEQNIYTLGPLIHNPQVVQKLESEGIRTIDSIDEIGEGTLIIRSHGVSPDILEKACGKGLKIIDATCPFVKQAQELAKTLKDEGYQVIVVGDRNHPEVMGIVGWTDNTAIIVENPEEAEKLPEMAKVGIVAQTTQPKENYNAVIKILKNKTGQLKPYNTICHATKERQESAAGLAQKVDIMIVVGGTNSANTRKLAMLCRETGTPTYHVEQASEIEKAWFAGKESVGVTAGASTPEWIIEEVIEKVKDLNIDNNNENTVEGPVNTDAGNQMKEAPMPRQISHGSIVKGTVVQVNDDEVMVDIGGKSEGVIPLRELSCCNIVAPREIFKNGDQFDLYVIKEEDNEGRMVLSKRRADAEKAWIELGDSFERQSDVEGIVTEVVKGGILLDVGVQAFMPASQIERGYVENLNQYIGQKLKGRVIEIHREKNKVVLSRKAILNEEYDEKKKEIWQQLKEGEIRKGIVKRVTNFGAFVDIGGIDGLLHVSEMAWHRVKNPSEILQPGDEVEVMILNVDKDKEKLSLGMKQTCLNPWVAAAEKYPAGTITKGKVVRLAPFGAFVELEPGIEGLVHLSQMSEKRVSKPEEVVSVGQEVDVKVVSVNDKEGKIGLSIKELAEDKEKNEYQNYMSKQKEDTITLGDVFGDLFKNKKEDE